MTTTTYETKETTRRSPGAATPVTVLGTGAMGRALADGDEAFDRIYEEIRGRAA